MNVFGIKSIMDYQIENTQLMTKHIIPHDYQISKDDRRDLHGHNSFLLWFTGLSGSGKSTIANVVEQELHQQGVKTSTLDRDNTRKGINSHLSLSAADRTETILRNPEITH